MASHNIVFLVDVDLEDHESDRQVNVKIDLIKRGILHVLLHFGYKLGLEKLRWGYKFFQSKASRPSNTLSRASDFKELRRKTFEDFEQEFESRFDLKDKLCSRRQKQQACQLVQNAVRETLLDFQWDRPDITSPTKPSLRPRKAGHAGKPSLTHEEDVSNNGKNVVFIVSQCPTSRAHFMDYLSCKEDELSSNPAEFVLSKILKDMLVQQQVLLHWIDTRSYHQVVRSEDLLGADEVSAVLAQVAGRVIPLVALLDLCCPQQSDSRLVRNVFGLKSCIGYLLSSESLFQPARPPTRGVLRWDRGTSAQSCGVTVEPVLCRQWTPQEPLDVFIKGVVPCCDMSTFAQFSTESWVLKEHCSEDQEAAAFQQLLRELSSLDFSMLAEVNVRGLECSAVLSPLSHSTALLTVLQPETPPHHQLLVTHAGAAQTPTELPDVVSSVLGVVYDIMNKEDEEFDDKMQDQPVPEWAQQELSRPAMTSLLEAWFPLSDMSGVSSHFMESFRLLSAVPEQSEEEELQQELVGGLSELYQASVDHVSKRGRKRGAHCTPVKQKMKTMSRSLQMLNVARLNVKALKNQSEDEQTSESRTADKPGKRRTSSRGKPAGQSSVSFTSEAELLTHLKTCYDRSVSDKDPSLLGVVQQLVTAVKAFLGTKSDGQGQISVFVQTHLLKTSKSIRQLYGAGADADSKVRECQLQVLLRLQLCSLLASEPADSLDADTMTEEAAEMLRIISLTKDPVFLSRFLLDEVIPGFLNAVPRDLANIYNNLGTQLPEVLMAVLPADFFSDESINKDSISASVSSSVTSASNSVSNGNGDLQDLRSRTASRKRSGMLTRHRSTTESSQSFRQVEIPKKASKAPLTGSVASDKPAVDLQTHKQEAKEVTKVRRNLFNQEVPKKSKLSRSRSVSAVEGLKRKRSDETEERHKLLTKKVCDTPIHKQVSSRLLHRQKIGRRSDVSEDFIVEESPVKPAEELRRSPRIQKFSRRHSSVFYSSSQSRSRNLDRALSSSQLSLTEAKACEVNVRTVKSPLRLLFGAAESPNRDPHAGTRTTRTRHSTDSSVFESPNKTPTKSPSRWGAAVMDGFVFGSPCTPKTPENKQTSSGAETPADGGSVRTMTLRNSPFRSPAKTAGDLKTPSKQSPMKSPLKGILKTPIKTHTDFPSGMGLRSHQAFRTPKKSVSWSPSPQKLKKVEKVSSFKVPESPKTASHSKLSSPVDSFTRAIFTTPTKMCQVKLVRMADQTLLTPEKTSAVPTHLNLTKTPEKDQNFSPPEKTASPVQQTMTPSDQALSPSLKESASSDASPSSLTCSSKGLKKMECKRKLTPNEKPAQNLMEENTNQSPQEEFSYSSSVHTDCSSQGNSATTDSDSLDIIDAAVVKSEFSGGLKMNISFSRKSSVSGQQLESPKHVGAASRSYGFRQTPDRQQREAAARLGYSNEFPRFSTPRGPKRLAQPKQSPLTYQVELEMQTSGLPKLKIKRTDFASDRSPTVGSSKPLFESPLAPLAKHKDAGCVSPSLCAHATPAKSTPLKGVGVQTFICQSYTPTRLPAAAPSPEAVANIIPLTPSPHHVGRAPPDSLNSWPRRKRPNMERPPKADPQLDELLEEAELGVSRLQDMEEEPAAPCGTAISPEEDLYWAGKLTEQNDHQGIDSDTFWFHENGDSKPTAETPPSSKKVKPVTASGILALTQSPLLFKSRAGSSHLRRSNYKQEASSENTEADGVDLSDSNLPVRHPRTGRSYSRKRLIH